MFCVLPQLEISEHYTVKLYKSLIVALSFNFALQRRLKQHAVSKRYSLINFTTLCPCGVFTIKM